MDDQLYPLATPPDPRMVGTPLSDLFRRAAMRLTADTPDSRDAEDTWTNLYNGSLSVPELVRRVGGQVQGTAENIGSTLQGVGRGAARWTYGGLAPGGLSSNRETNP
jgi:hypothetical protein